MQRKAPSRSKKAKPIVAALVETDAAEGNKYPGFDRSGAGRKSRLEADDGLDLAEAIFKAVSEGDSITNAMAAHGVPHSTESDWSRKAKEGQAPYEHFYTELQMAKAQFRSKCVRAIYHIGFGGLKGGNYKALLDLLERRYPEEFAQARRVEVTGAGGAPFNAGTMSMKELAEVLKTVDPNFTLPKGETEK